MILSQTPHVGPREYNYSANNNSARLCSCEINVSGKYLFDMCIRSPIKPSLLAALAPPPRLSPLAVSLNSNPCRILSIVIFSLFSGSVDRSSSCCQGFVLIRVLSPWAARMTQSGKLMPNLDQKSTKALNLTVLQRIDPFVEEILMTATHVTFYEFNIELNQWVRLDRNPLLPFFFDPVSGWPLFSFAPSDLGFSWLVFLCLFRAGRMSRDRSSLSRGNCGSCC